MSEVLSYYLAYYAKSLRDDLGTQTCQWILLTPLPPGIIIPLRESQTLQWSLLSNSCLPLGPVHKCNISRILSGSTARSSSRSPHLNFIRPLCKVLLSFCTCYFFGFTGNLTFSLFLSANYKILY